MPICYFWNISDFQFFLQKTSENNDTYPTEWFGQPGFLLVWSTERSMRPAAQWHIGPGKNIVDHWRVSQTCRLMGGFYRIFSFKDGFIRKTECHHSTIPRWQTVSMATPLNSDTSLSKSQIWFRIKYNIEYMSSLSACNSFPPWNFEIEERNSLYTINHHRHHQHLHFYHYWLFPSGHLK